MPSAGQSAWATSQRSSAAATGPARCVTIRRGRWKPSSDKEKRHGCMVTGSDWPCGSEQAYKKNICLQSWPASSSRRCGGPPEGDSTYPPAEEAAMHSMDSAPTPSHGRHHGIVVQLFWAVGIGIACGLPTPAGAHPGRWSPASPLTSQGILMERAAAGSAPAMVRDAAARRGAACPARGAPVSSTAVCSSTAVPGVIARVQTRRDAGYGGGGVGWCWRARAESRRRGPRPKTRGRRCEHPAAGGGAGAARVPGGRGGLCALRGRSRDRRVSHRPGGGAADPRASRATWGGRARGVGRGRPRSAVRRARRRLEGPPQATQWGRAYRGVAVRGVERGEELPPRGVERARRAGPLSHSAELLPAHRRPIGDAAPGLLGGVPGAVARGAKRLDGHVRLARGAKRLDGHVRLDSMERPACGRRVVLSRTRGTTVAGMPPRTIAG